MNCVWIENKFFFYLKALTIKTINYSKQDFTCWYAINYKRLWLLAAPSAIWCGVNKKKKLYFTTCGRYTHNTKTHALQLMYYSRTFISVCAQRISITIFVVVGRWIMTTTRRDAQCRTVNASERIYLSQCSLSLSLLFI